MASSLGSLLAKMDHRLGSHVQMVNGGQCIGADVKPDVDDQEPHPRWETISFGKYDEYHVIYQEKMHIFSKSLRQHGKGSKRFVLYNTRWDKFADGSDDIEIEGSVGVDNIVDHKIDSPTYFKGKDILFVASFHSNEDTMSQFHVLAHLCESFANSLTILLPFYATGTMERVDIGKNGVIPTANTLARLFNGLPQMGNPIRLMTYDLHTLQNRFYLTGHAIASLHTAVPLICKRILSLHIDCIAFPDAGAHKRFSDLFDNTLDKTKRVICGKVRSGDRRIVSIIEGHDALFSSKHVLIVDDMTRTGETLAACAVVLKAAFDKKPAQPQPVPTDDVKQFSADEADTVAKRNSSGYTAGNSLKVSAFVTHSVFDNDFFLNRDPKLFTDLDTFFTTDSIPNEISQSLKSALNPNPVINIGVARRGEARSEEFHGTTKIEILHLCTQVIKDL